MVCTPAGSGRKHARDVSAEGVAALEEAAGEQVDVSEAGRSGGGLIKITFSGDGFLKHQDGNYGGPGGGVGRMGGWG